MCNHQDHQHTNQPSRLGSALEHGAAHERDHQQWSRRSFLHTLGLSGGSAFLLANLPISALLNAPLAVALSESNNSDAANRILVLIRLKGGNDGLNTLIPIFDYGRYQALRPTIRVAQNDTFALNTAFAMPKTMSALQGMWTEGQMKVVHSVGYAEQNLSHFRSSDIWASASDSNVLDNSGWLGRYLQEQYPDYLNNPPAVPPAVQIGSVGNLAFNDTNNVSISVSVNDPNELYEIARLGRLYDLTNLPECLYGEQLGYMRSVANSTFFYAETIKRAYDSSTTQAEYSSSLGRQLAMVARLIKGNLGTRLYMVTLDGFDTHARQNELHPQLLKDVADSVSAFYHDLAAGNRQEDVVTATISEFGRRPEQNASGGTDHGAAAPMLLFGAGLNGNGLLGTPPDLQNFDNDGNLRFGTDFRQVYATLLENWLCVDAITVNQVLGRDFNRIALGLNCLTPTSVQGAAVPGITHNVRYLSPRDVIISYTLPTATQLRVEIFNLLGQPVATLFNGYQMAGTHEVQFSATGYLASGQYFYRIQAGERVSGQAIRIVR